MNKNSNDLVWEILSDDEKGALVLSHNHGKSTWQAGEIMNKAHYKYLEIQGRANKFFRMFTEYFNLTKGVKIPNTIGMDQNFKTFITLAVFERKSLRETIKEMGHCAFMVAAARNRIIGEQLEELSKHDDPLAQALYDIILEFDRWNNARILPIEVQEPSAFKRRNKSRLLKHLTNLSNLDPFHINRFIERFKAGSKDRKPYYIALISKDFEGGYDVVAVKRKDDIIEHVSKHLRLYMFDTQVDADQYGFLVSRYIKDQNKDCKAGQKFWPLYRTSILTAANYLNVNNIIPRRKNLEKAFRDMDNLTIRKNSKITHNINDGQKRIDSQALWDI